MLLINELNKIYQESPFIALKGWNEKQSTGFTIQFDMKANKIIAMSGINDLDFAQLLWHAGILHLEDNDVLQAIQTYLKGQSVRPKSIGIDTNIILNRFLTNFTRQHYPSIHDRFQAIIVVPQASSHEFHYKAGFQLKNDNSALKAFGNYIRGTPIIAKLFTETQNPDLVKHRLNLIKSYDGRLGMKGELELRRLQRTLPVLLTKSTHLYYGAVLNMQRNVDALFDSLIRVEINQITNVTNMELLFLTSDKDQYETATTEGIQSIYLQPPTKWLDLLDPAPQNINLENLTQLIQELLFFSPHLEIQAGQMDTSYYSFFWHNKQSADNIQTVIRKLNPSGHLEYLTLF